MSWSLIPQAYASCTPGDSNGFSLADCVKLGNSDQNVADVYKTPADLINTIVPNLFLIAGIMVFLMIMYSGYLFIQSGSKGKDEAKSVMTAAVGGLIVMFVAYWIVQIIEIMIGQPIL